MYYMHITHTDVTVVIEKKGQDQLQTSSAELLPASQTSPSVPPLTHSPPPPIIDPPKVRLPMERGMQGAEVQCVCARGKK